jgi:hypothetical protein
MWLGDSSSGEAVVGWFAGQTAGTVAEQQSGRRRRALLLCLLVLASWQRCKRSSACMVDAMRKSPARADASYERNAGHGRRAA